MEKNRQSLKSLRAGISMVKYNSQLGVEDKYNGVVIYLPGAGRQASVRIDWSSPRREVIAVDEQQIHDLPSGFERCLHWRLAQNAWRTRLAA